MWMNMLGFGVGTRGQGWPYFDLGTILSLEPKRQRRQVAAAYLVTSLSYCHHKKIGLRHSDIRSGAISKTEKYMVSLLPFAFGMGFGNRRNNHLVTTRFSRSIAIIHYRLLVHKFKTLQIEWKCKTVCILERICPLCMKYEKIQDREMVLLNFVLALICEGFFAYRCGK